MEGVERDSPHGLWAVSSAQGVMREGRRGKIRDVMMGIWVIRSLRLPLPSQLRLVHRQHCYWGGVMGCVIRVEGQRGLHRCMLLC